MKGPLAHPPKIPGALNKPGSGGLRPPVGSRGNAPVGCPGVLCARTASPGVLYFFLFIIINLLFLFHKQTKKQNVENLHDV